MILKFNEFNNVNIVNEGLWDSLKGFLSKVNKYFGEDPTDEINAIDDTKKSKEFNHALVKNGERILITVEVNKNLDTVLLQRIGTSENHIIYAILYISDNKVIIDPNADDGDFLIFKNNKVLKGQKLYCNGIDFEHMKLMKPRVLPILHSVIYYNNLPPQLKK